MIRTAVNAYNHKIEDLTGEDMYDIAAQRDMARECVLEIESVLALWRNWRKEAKRGP